MASTASYFPVPFHLQNAGQAAVSLPAMAPIPTPVPVPVPASGTYSLLQYQQAQQLFQKDAQIITPEALENVKAALSSNEQKAKRKREQSLVRQLDKPGKIQHWQNGLKAKYHDYRLFCGDLGNEVNDDVLTRAFSRFPSFNMARVVRDKRTGKTKGYGFVSFANSSDLLVALKEMNGKYVGNRPIKLRKSTWKKRIDYEALEKQKNQSPKKQKPLKKSVLHK